jgi:hypothetical protein
MHPCLACFLPPGGWRRRPAHPAIGRRIGNAPINGGSSRQRGIALLMALCSIVLLSMVAASFATVPRNEPLQLSRGMGHGAWKVIDFS